MHGGEVVQDTLQFIIFDPIANHYQLFQEQQYVGTNCQNILLRGTRSINSFWCDATLGTWIGYPVIVLERVDSLEHSRHTPHGRVDLCIGQELSGQVGVEACLDGSRSVDPQRWVEEHVVQQLPRQEREREQLFEQQLTV